MLSSESIFYVILIIVSIEASRCWLGVFEVFTLQSVHNLVVWLGLEICLSDDNFFESGLLLSSILDSGTDVRAIALLPHDPPTILTFWLLRFRLKLHAAGNSALAHALHHAVQADASQEGSNDQARQ